jgi:Domain of unknown function (DUF5710)
MRYWLRIPPQRRRQAILSGCQYDSEKKQWYVEEPFKRIKNIQLTLEDFQQWNPLKPDGRGNQIPAR